MNIIKEAISELNNNYINLLLVRNYRKLIEEYLQLRKELNDFQGKQARLKKSGYSISDSEIGAIKNRKESINKILSNLPTTLYIEDLVKLYKSFSQEDLQEPLTKEELRILDNYLFSKNQAAKTPKVGQEFKFSSVSTTYEIVKIENEVITYKTTRYGDGRTWTYPLELFLKEKDSGKIYYI